MLKYFIWVMRFVIIGIIYFLLYRILKTMYIDLMDKKKKKTTSLECALEVMDAPENIGIQNGNIFPIHAITNIGRNSDNNIIIDDQFVSNEHARIIIKESKLYLQDLNSTNGVIVNGIKISALTEVFEGDRIEIGRAMFTIIE